MPPPAGPPSGAFTYTGTNRALELVIDVQLSLPYFPGKSLGPPPPTFPAKALLDTGATNCAITKKKADEIGLAPIGKANVCHAQGQSTENVYLLNLLLPNRFFFTVRATECKSATGNFDFIIGMEIITLGDLSITNKGGATTLSFRVPSEHTIDYVKAIELQKQILKLGRNDPCPCGSGKKTKSCHG